MKAGVGGAWGSEAPERDMASPGRDVLPKRGVAMVAGLIACASPAGATPKAIADGDVAQPVGPCLPIQICAFADPEDLADLPGTPWLIVSEGAEQGGSGLTGLDARTGAIVRFAAAALGPSCLPGARGGGIGLRRERGGYHLIRVLHTVGGGGDAVESFRVAMVDGRPILTRTGCIAAPAPYFLNDVAPLPDGGFAATHMFDPAIPRAVREAAFLRGVATGYVVRWSPRSGWRRVPGSDGSFLNGIAVSADGRWLAFAETYGRAVNRIRPDGGERTRLPLAMQPDNVTALGRTRFVVAGGTGRPLVSTRRCPELRRPGCGFRAAAVEVDFARPTVRTIAVSAGRAAPGFSVGLVKRGRLYLGTAFGDRITVLPVTGEPATIP